MRYFDPPLRARVIALHLSSYPCDGPSNSFMPVGVEGVEGVEGVKAEEKYHNPRERLLAKESYCNLCPALRWRSWCNTALIWS